MDEGTQAAHGDVEGVPDQEDKAKGYPAYPEPAVALDSIGRDPSSVATIIARARKATDALGITWTPRGQNVQNIVANRYFKLNDIYAERDTLKKTNKALAEATCDSRLYRSHFDFDADLSIYPTNFKLQTSNIKL